VSDQKPPFSMADRLFLSIGGIDPGKIEQAFARIPEGHDLVAAVRIGEVRGTIHQGWELEYCCMCGRHVWSLPEAREAAATIGGTGLSFVCLQCVEIGQ
jgi:hypothetical protein